MTGGAWSAGRPGSLAARLYDATKDGGEVGVVTAERLIVVRHIGVGRFEPLAEVRRSDVVAARRRGKPFQRGRVVLTFTDGSTLATTSGLLFTGHARRLVAALSR